MNLCKFYLLNLGLMLGRAIEDLEVFDLALSISCFSFPLVSTKVFK